MKLLIDQNLPGRLVPALQERFPGSLHVNEAGLGGARDIEVWNYALRGAFDIMSRDADMAMLAVRKVGDVCVVWVRLGNMPLRALLASIRDALADLQQALRTRSLRVVEIRGGPGATRRAPPRPRRGCP